MAHVSFAVLIQADFDIARSSVLLPRMLRPTVTGLFLLVFPLLAGLTWIIVRYRLTENNFTNNSGIHGLTAWRNYDNFFRP